jgi:hypothetical protein
LRGRQERDATDVLQEELQRVGRDVRLGRRKVELLLLGSRVEDLDLKLVECLVELVELRRLEPELVERKRDLLVRQEPSFLPLTNERPRFLVLKRYRFRPLSSSPPTAFTEISLP